MTQEMGQFQGLMNTTIINKGQMAWTELLTNKDSILSIYSNTPPSLTSVELHKVCLDRDGPQLDIYFDLASFPEFPPKKWHLKEYNSVQVHLVLIDLQSVLLSGWTDTSYIIDIDVQRSCGNINFSIANSTLIINCVAKFMTIANLSAYCKRN